MLNETQEVAFQNTLILGETHKLSLTLCDLTLDDAVELAMKLLGGNAWDRPKIAKTQVDETFVVTGQIEGTQIDFTIFCLPVVTATPFGAIASSDEVREEVERRDG